MPSPAASPADQTLRDARASGRRVSRTLVAAPRNARRRRLADGSQVVSYSLADAFADPTCWKWEHAAPPPTPARRLPVPRRTAPRARGAGRPAGRSSRGSPDGDPDSDEPPGDLAGGRAQTLSGPSPRFSAPWRPDLDRQVAGRLDALGAPGDGRGTA